MAPNRPDNIGENCTKHSVGSATRTRRKMQVHIIVTGSRLLDELNRSEKIASKKCNNAYRLICPESKHGQPRDDAKEIKVTELVLEIPRCGWCRTV